VYVQHGPAAGARARRDGEARRDARDARRAAKLELRAAFRFAAYTNGARVDFAISGVESGPPSKPATGASADTAAKPRRGVAKNDGAAAAAPPGPVAKKRGEASAAKTSAPPTAPPRLGVVRRASAPSVSDKATTLGTTPSLVGVNGVTTSNANPFDGARACVSESERRAPTGTFALGLRAGAANVASDALEGASATGATVPYVAASASSTDTARSLCPASVTRAPPCSLTATGETSRMVGGGVATSVAAEEPRALENASAPASATRVACAPAGSAMGVSQIASADETATATGKDAANGTAVAAEAIAHTTTPEPPSRRRSAPETNTVAPPPACAAVGATARARGGATNSKEICALPIRGVRDERNRRRLRGEEKVQREESLHERVRRGETLRVDARFRSRDPRAGSPLEAAPATPPYAHPSGAAATRSGDGPGTSSATTTPRSPPKTPPPAADVAGGNANAGRAAETKLMTETPSRLVERASASSSTAANQSRRFSEARTSASVFSRLAGATHVTRVEAVPASTPRGVVAFRAGAPRHRAHRAEAAPRGDLDATARLCLGNEAHEGELHRGPARARRRPAADDARRRRREGRRDERRVRRRRRRDSGDAGDDAHDDDVRVCRYG